MLAARAPVLRSAASYRPVRCAIHSTAKNDVQATSGFETNRAGPLCSTRANDRREAFGHAARASVSGAPSSSSGAATIVSSRCWTMCIENEDSTDASIGPVSASSDDRQAGEERRPRGRAAPAGRARAERV